MMVSPSAANPASTSDTEARRSVAIIGAPFRESTPLIVAVLPCTVILAPILLSSGTCINRFSKIVSVMIEAPLAMLINAMIWACMSVGKPGYGWVVTSTLLIPCLLCFTTMLFSFMLIEAPASSNFSNTVPNTLGFVPTSSSWPLVIIAAVANVAASMRSAMIWCDAPCRRSWPSIVRVLVPIPSIFAPIADKQFARSVISGSLAAFVMTLVPFARVAAMRALTVAPTDTASNWISAPFRRPRHEAAT